MKRISILALSFIMMFVLTACGSQSSNQTNTSTLSTENNIPSSDEKTETEENADVHETTENEHEILVVYFSLAKEQYEVGEIEEGNTEIVAKMIAEETGADLFAIQPVKEYADDYNGKLEEATKERENDERPEIANEIENFDEYDTIFIGYPIWWGGLPMIMYTFMESYDFSGKTVIPFNTHAGSGQAGTQQEIESVLTNATILDGLAIRGKTAQEDPDTGRKEVINWLSEMEY